MSDRQSTGPPTGQPTAGDDASRASRALAQRDPRHRRGAAAEQAAREHLERHGLRTLLANFRTCAGELDLVMRDADVLAVVEVRCRSGANFGGALGSVVGRKQRRIVAAAGLLLRYRPAFARLPIRFDVVAVTPLPGGAWACDWVRDAFRA